jgi:hypothetical protein
MQDKTAKRQMVLAAAIQTIATACRKPHSWSKVYRWKWRAKLAAAQFPSMGGIYITTKIEAYWPDCDNVVSLRAA